MSAPRGPHGGGPTSGRSTPPPGSRGRGAGRDNTSSQFRGRGGRGRGTPLTTNPKAEGLLQGLQTGSFNKRGGSGSTQPGRGERILSLPRKRTEMCSKPNPGARFVPTQPRHFSSLACLPKKGRSSAPRDPSRSTRGHGAILNRANASFVQSSNTTARANPSQKDFMTEMTTKFQDLKRKREGERAKAIRDGFLADPDKKTSLDKAITPVGTCTEMCPEFERVERIVQNMVEKSEKIPNEATGRDMPTEERMVKRFRRSAAGYDEQLPSDIRTPATLQATLNYLLSDVIGGDEQLAAIHKFVWDRTRGIRNDFSIQQVSKDEDVRLAVDCFERIARFHILSLHQLSNPDNLTGEGFDAHQEREQLNNTLLSLMYYYDDNRDKQRFPNEAEFRAYCIIFELQSSHPDLEDRMQSWPLELLNDKRVQTAFRLYSAATNTLFEQGPLKPTASFSIAQGHSGAFWKLLKSKAVSYMMSCVAEIYFGQIRYMSLQNLWESHKGPSGQQIRNQEWTLDELTDALAFDDGEETLRFCQGYGLDFKTSADGTYHLDFTSQASPLDQLSTPNKQVFSHSIVEAKRYRRSLVAVINGIGVARAIREGLVEADPQQDGEQSDVMEGDSSEGLFFPENSTRPSSFGENKPASIFNPEASYFIPGAATQSTWPSSTTSFGKPSAVTLFAPSASTSSASTSIGPLGSSFPSFLPTSSTTSSPGFGIGSIPFVDPFAPKPQPPTSSSSASTTFRAPSTLPSFKFGQSTSSPPPATSTSTPFSFGKPSTAPSTFGRPSALQQDAGKEQSKNLEKAGDAPIFAPSLPGIPMPVTFSRDPFDEQNEAFPPPRSDSQPLTGPPSPGSQQPRQENREPAHDRPPIFQEALPPFSTPQGQPENSVDGPIPLKPPPSPRPAQLELSEDSAKPLPSFLPPNTGTGFRFESPFTTPSPFNVLPPRSTDANTTQPPTTAVFAPRPLASPDPSSSIPSALANAPPPSSSWNTSAPSGASTSNQPPPIRPESPTLLPSQYPAPVVPPKARKTIQPQPKVLKAVSPRDPTPRASSPLRERPVIFGDNANAFRQSVAFATNPPPTRTAISAHERDTAADTVARLAMLQPAGLMQEYLQFTLPDLLKPIMQHHKREKPLLAAKAARHQILAKKYFKRWRASTYRRAINRRARDRRQMRIDALEQQKQKRMRGEAELEAIIQAKKEKERVQAEMLARSANEASPSVSNGVQQTAGQKRKSIHVDRMEDSINGHTPRKIAKGHNRSKTVGHAQELFNSSRSAANQASAITTTPQSRSSIFSGRSILNGSGASQGLRRSLSGRKDTTRTDYFRLKAHGIDPDTPIVPDTKASLERKGRLEEVAIAATRTRAQILSSTARPPVPRSSPQGAAASGTSGLNYSWTPPKRNIQTAPPSAAGKVDDDDDLLRRIREVREAMTEDAKWFKTQAVNIEKEIEGQEELRGSASQASTRPSPNPSASGLARANGYEYLPGPEIPGSSLSRTEQRIRRTGAHGLATKPIGGSGDYLAVAMSRDSAAKLNMGKPSQRAPEVPRTTEKTRKGKRRMGEKDGKYIPQQSDEDSEEREDDAELNGLDHHPEPRTNGKVRVTEATRRSAEPDEELAEEYTDAEEEDDYVQKSLQQPQYIGYDEFEDGDTEDLYEDGDDEQEQYDEHEEGEEGDGEEEEADEGGSLPHQQGQKGQGQPVGYWLRSSVTPERGLTPNGAGQMMSRASSGMGTGTGASADDALILDSD